MYRCWFLACINITFVYTQVQHLYVPHNIHTGIYTHTHSGVLTRLCNTVYSVISFLKQQVSHNESFILVFIIYKVIELPLNQLMVWPSDLLPFHVDYSSKCGTTIYVTDFRTELCEMLQEQKETSFGLTTWSEYYSISSECIEYRFIYHMILWQISIFMFNGQSHHWSHLMFIS